MPGSLVCGILYGFERFMLQLSAQHYLKLKSDPQFNVYMLVFSSIIFTLCFLGWRDLYDDFSYQRLMFSNCCFFFFFFFCGFSACEASFIKYCIYSTPILYSCIQHVNKNKFYSIQSKSMSISRMWKSVYVMAFNFINKAIKMYQIVRLAKRNSFK